MNDPVPEKVVIGEAVLYQELEREIVLLNMASEQYYGLNDTGARMWKSLLESESVNKAAERLCGNYEVDEAVIRADLDGLVRRLLTAGLLQAA